MSEDTDKPPYDVGYARPPKHSRFKSGQSGNPRGRPRAAKNASTIIRQALAEKVPLKGSSRKMSKLELGITQLANKAASGDLKAIGMVLALHREVEAEAAAQTKEQPLDHADREILDMLLQKVRAASKGSEHGK